MLNDFAVFILSNGRANRVITYNTLRRCGYTGLIYILVDDEDAEINEYKKKYKSQVVVFSKKKAIEITDSGDNFRKRNSVVFARNINFEIAKKMGIKYFLQLDDDYSSFDYTFNSQFQYITKKTKIIKMDVIFKIFLNFLKSTKITTIAFAQGGDFIGGVNSTVSKLYLRNKMSRKAMNSFFCATDRPFKFSGRINEDVNTYVMMGMRGHLFYTYGGIRLNQLQTQANEGGLTDIYLDLGTYVKSFYSVIYAPSCVGIARMGVKNKRIHHIVKWRFAVPKFLNEEIKKL